MPNDEGMRMPSSPFFRVSGLALWVGAMVFSVHIVARSVITSGPDPATVAKTWLWGPINALGALGAALVLLGLPAIWARLADRIGRLGVVGVVLIALAWMFFGLFLSLYGALVAPWLAEQAPALMAVTTPLPTGFIVAFIAGLLAELTGSVFLGIPFLRGHVQPRWVGYLLPASAIWAVLGNLLIAPSGPASDLPRNLLSNAGPVLQMIALGYLGFRMWLPPPGDMQLLA